MSIIFFKNIKEINSYIAWLIRGKPVPPPDYVKEKIIKKYTLMFSPKVFIETGTYYGDKVDTLKNLFTNIISVELDNELYEKAKHRFKNYSNIKIIQGDSSRILPKVLPGISEKILFWLDGHFSEGITKKGNLNTPIMEELEAISHCTITNNVILIDDARLFNGTADYPTIEALKKYIAKKFPRHIMIVANDIIQIYKR